MILEIRFVFGASTAEEDERDLDKVHFDINLYELYVERVSGDGKRCSDTGGVRESSGGAQG